MSCVTSQTALGYVQLMCAQEEKKITNATKDTAKNCSNNCLEILISPSFPERIPYNSLIINVNKVNSSLLTSESKDIC